ncbi:hypothetical protein [Streptomyces erythrochromogenes]|uniref:hypothetical protein n=1 Tax=Streptomyces erythrochromogenes TaxID=285574 RepID=UPI0036FD8400
MTSAERTMEALRGARWRRWPRWAAWATMLWAVMYAGFGLACVLSGTSLLYHGGGSAAPGLGWAVVVVGVLGALLGVAVVRYGLRPALRVLLWVACGLAGITAFSLLMDVITLMLGQGVDSLASAANKACPVAAVVLDDRHQCGDPGGRTGQVGAILRRRGRTGGRCCRGRRLVGRDLTWGQGSGREPRPSARLLASGADPGATR